MRTPNRGPHPRRPSPRLAEFLGDTLAGRPVWVRAPKIGPENFSGLTRSKLYALAGEGKIRSVSLREPGKLTGTRLFNLASVLAFIEKQEEEFMRQQAAEGKGGGQ